MRERMIGLVIAMDIIMSIISGLAVHDWLGIDEINGAATLVVLGFLCGVFMVLSLLPFIRVVNAYDDQVEEPEKRMPKSG